MSQKTFNPPGNVNDFDQNSDLAKSWDTTVAELFQNSIDSLKERGIEENKISIFDPRSSSFGSVIHCSRYLGRISKYIIGNSC